MAIISKANKEILIKRLKSFVWRFAMLFAAGLTDLLLQSIGLFDLPNEATIVLGLLLGELSKWLNTK